MTAKATAAVRAFPMRDLHGARPGAPFLRMRWPLAVTLVMLLGLLGGCSGERGVTAAQVSLTEVQDFGAPDSNLRMYKYVPPTAGSSPPMVVILHHCFQNAPDYLLDSGWVDVADRYGLVLLMPEQSAVNNPMLCFNWSLATNQIRGSGEPESIHRMVERMIVDHNIDQRRIFVTGLSSGGSMTLVMLALYPETFAAGAAVGSVPFGCAVAEFDALTCMLVGDVGITALSGDALAGRIRRASHYQGPWPRLQVWEGSDDIMTTPINARDIVRQWTALLGVQDTPPETEIQGLAHMKIYRDATGQPAVELIMLEGVGHSLPIDKAHGCGDRHPGFFGGFVRDMGICSSEWMARFWGLSPVAPATAALSRP